MTEEKITMEYRVMDIDGVSSGMTTTNIQEGHKYEKYLSEIAKTFGDEMYKARIQHAKLEILLG